MAIPAFLKKFKQHAVGPLPDVQPRFAYLDSYGKTVLFDVEQIEQFLRKGVELTVIVEIDQRSDVPIYEQLHRQLIAAIVGDELSPGDSLPSVRSLAVDLGINLHTVNKAYALLRDEGYIVSVVVPVQPSPSMTAGEKHRTELPKHRMSGWARNSIALPWPTGRAAVIRPHSSMPPNGNANGHTACAPRRALLTVQQKGNQGEITMNNTVVSMNIALCAIFTVAGDSDRRPGRGSMGYRPA